MMKQKVNKFDLATELINYTKTNVFLTGKAGTGKTTFLRGLLETCPKKSVVVAPTGIAAINAKGVTMHSFFQLPFCPFLPDANAMASSVCETNALVIKELELLIIDEVSMLRADMLDAIDYRLRTTRGIHEPFGGVQLLLIGDLFQLPPVAVEEEQEQLKPHYDSLFFFESKALKNSNFITIEFDEVLRQEGKEFKAILNNIREGNVSRQLLEQLNTRYIPNFTPPKNESYIRLVTHNSQVDKVNKEEIEKLEGEERTYKAFISGDFPASMFPVSASLKLKVGTQVMTTKNKTIGILTNDGIIKQQLYYNGALGVVTDMRDDVVEIMLLDSNEMIEIGPETWEKIEYKVKEEEVKDSDGRTKKEKIIEEVVVGTFIQFPLRPAWAITIHKSQGLSFDHAIIDVSRSFMAGQTYVALSRCRSLEGLVLSQKVDWKSIKCDPFVKEFYKKVNKCLDIADRDELLKEGYVSSLRSHLSMSRLEGELVSLVNDAMKSNDTIDSADIDSLITAHRDFSLSSGIRSEATLSPIVALINQTKAYSQNDRIQKMISEVASHHLASIRKLADSLTALENRISCKKTDYQLDTLKFAVFLYRTMGEHIKENGFDLLECGKVLKNYDCFLHVNLNFDGTPKTSTDDGDNSFSPDNTEETREFSTSDDAAAYNENMTVLLWGPKKQTAFTVPDTVKTIGREAFMGSKLKFIRIPDSVTTIEQSAFYDCKNLLSVDLPKSVETIGDDAFYGCSSLAKVNIPGSVKRIGRAAFMHCSSLTSFVVPDSLDVLKDWTFHDCSELESLYIPKSVYSLGDYLITKCPKLKVEVSKENRWFKSVDGKLLSKDGKTEWVTIAADSDRFEQ